MHRLSFLCLAFFIACSTSASAQGSTAAASEPNVENGRYMYFAGGCGSCHAAPASAKCSDPGTKDYFKPIGGRCLKSDFGTFYVPNITPDKENGLGAWSEQDFIRAMTKGKSPDGSNYYPAFPYVSYQRMKRTDLRDLWAFLKTLEPISSTVPKHDLSFPYNIRFGVSIWKALYLDGETFKPDPAKSAELNRGAYLVEGPGHCGECHTPRNSLGGKIEAKKLSGGPAPDGDGTIPNITPDKTGIGSWSEKDIVFALETGYLPNGDFMGSSMAAVQKNMAHLTGEDREAIAAYLKSIPPIASQPSKAK